VLLIFQLLKFTAGFKLLFLLSVDAVQLFEVLFLGARSADTQGLPVGGSTMVITRAERGYSLDRPAFILAFTVESILGQVSLE